MEEQRPNSVEPIPNADWEDASECQTAGRGLTFRVTQLEEQIGALQTEKNYCETAKADIGKLIPTTITRPSERIQAESPEQSGKKRGDKQDMRDMDVSFIRLKSATASRTITQMRAGTVVRV